jgi:MFS family permease
MVGYRAIEGGANPLFLGLMASAFALPALIAALPAGRVSDRLGGSIVATTGLVVAATGVTITLVFPALPILLVASAVIGLGHILIMVGQQTFVAHASSRGSSDAAFGTLTAAASIGQLIGPPTVTIIASLLIFSGSSTVPNTTVGLLVCLGFTAIAMPVIFFLRSADSEMRTARSTTPAPAIKTLPLLRTPGLWQSLVVSGAVLVTVDLMYAFVPVWAVEQGISATAVGLLLALRAAVSVVSRFGLTRLVSRFGRKSLIIVSIAAASAGLIALPFVGLWGAIPVMVGLGLGLGIPQPLTMAWVTSLTPPSTHGAVLGMRLTSNRLAQISLPLAVGAIAAPLGVIGIFWSNALLLLGAIAVMSRSDKGES